MKEIVTVSDKIEHTGRKPLGHPGRVHHCGDRERQEAACKERKRVAIANGIRRAEDKLADNKRRTVVGPRHHVGTRADNEFRVQPAMARPAAGVVGSE